MRLIFFKISCQTNFILCLYLSKKFAVRYALNEAYHWLNFQCWIPTDKNERLTEILLKVPVCLLTSSNTSSENMILNDFWSIWNICSDTGLRNVVSTFYFLSPLTWKNTDLYKRILNDNLFNPSIWPTHAMIKSIFFSMPSQIFSCATLYMYVCHTLSWRWWEGKREWKIFTHYSYINQQISERHLDATERGME